MVGIGGVTHAEEEADGEEGERGNHDQDSLFDLVLWGVKLLPEQSPVKQRHENHEMHVLIPPRLRRAVRVEDNCPDRPMPTVRSCRSCSRETP